MLHGITVSKASTCALLVLMTSLSLVECKTLVKSNTLKTVSVNTHNTDSNSKQLLFLNGVARETSIPDFVRLVVMRFIYGLASTMGVEERLEGLFNGAFVPPNADIDLFGLGGYGDDAIDGNDFDEAAFSGLFDDDVF